MLHLLVIQWIWVKIGGNSVLLAVTYGYARWRIGVTASIGLPHQLIKQKLGRDIHRVHIDWARCWSAGKKAATKWYEAIHPWNHWDIPYCAILP